MKTLADLKIGDTAIIQSGSRYRADEEVVVVKVGRVYLQVLRDGRSWANRYFRIDNGRERGDGYGAGAYLRTEEQIEHSVRRLTAVNRLKELGIELGFSQALEFSAETLEAIIAVIPEPEPS